MTFPVQVSENNQGRIFVIGGADADEFLSNAEKLLGDADAASALMAEFRSVFAPKPVSQYQAVQTAERLLGAVPVEVPPTEGRSCAHGQRTKRTGTNTRGQWTGYFCPLQKGDPAQCKAVFE